MAAPGLGHDHQRRRAWLLSRLRPGTPCGRCGEPMDPRRQRLELDHVIPRALGGHGGPVRITHAVCNRRDGGELKRLMLRTARGCPLCRCGSTQKDRIALVARCLTCRSKVAATLGIVLPELSSAPRPALRFFDV